MAEPKQFTRSEVSLKNDAKNTMLIIHNKVYNVTPFLNEVSTYKKKKILISLYNCKNIVNSNKIYLLKI